jgi:hypothetical protein
MTQRASSIEVNLAQVKEFLDGKLANFKNISCHGFIFKNSNFCSRSMGSIRSSGGPSAPPCVGGG